MSKAQTQVIVIGAGAAGLMTAIQAARLGLSVELLDSRKIIGAKILMSGGTRCNVTNRLVTEKDFFGEQPRKIRDVLRAFTAETAVRFFSDLGVKLFLEEGGKYFPGTHSAQTVLDALKLELQNSGAKLVTEARVTGIKKTKEGFVIQSAAGEFHAQTCVLTTGGLSFPSSGSDGTGYTLAQSLGHSMIQTMPSLTPFTTHHAKSKELSGLASDVRLTLVVENKKTKTFEGAMLFTHFGYSGPVALNMSRHWLAAKDKPNTQIQVSFLPALNQEEFVKEVDKMRYSSAGKNIKIFLAHYLPSRLAEFVLSESKVIPERKFYDLRKEELKSLIQNLFSYPLPVNGTLGYEKAEVTAGGINMDEVDSKTLESKITPGLFLAGEILDVDGRIGGFNFQWAWSSGTVAARGLAKKLKSS